MKKILFMYKIYLLAAVIGSSLKIENISTRDLTEYLIKSEGYCFEEYKVQTKDGYILIMFRICGSEVSPQAKGKPAVLLLHGLMNSSKDWLVLGKGKSLPYLLADAGFDVFLGNTRGNTYGQEHVNYSIYDSRFWRFSWDDMGIYDIPAMVDIALNVTGEDSLHYIAHSQGTAAFFVAAATSPEFNDKIKTMHAFAPTIFIGRMRSYGLRLISSIAESFESLMQLTGTFNVAPHSETLSVAVMNACKEGSIFEEVCVNAVFLICGYDSELLNRTLLPIILRHTSTSTSVLQLAHWGQLLRTGRFQKYNYGYLQNFIAYGSIDPPDFDLRAIKVPVYLHYSDNDWLVAESDVQELEKSLGNLVDSSCIPHGSFNHLDYIYGVNVDKLLYKPVIRSLLEDEENYFKNETNSCKGL